jgi:hypothetical protein
MNFYLVHQAIVILQCIYSTYTFLIVLKDFSRRIGNIYSGISMIAQNSKEN